MRHSQQDRSGVSSRIVTVHSSSRFSSHHLPLSLANPRAFGAREAPWAAKDCEDGRIVVARSLGSTRALLRLHPLSAPIPLWSLWPITGGPSCSQVPLHARSVVPSPNDIRSVLAFRTPYNVHRLLHVVLCTSHFVHHTLVPNNKQLTCRPKGHHEPCAHEPWKDPHNLLCGISRGEQKLISGELRWSTVNRRVRPYIWRYMTGADPKRCGSVRRP